MDSFIKKQDRRFRNALRGIFLASRDDLNFKLGLLSGIFFLVFGYLMWPLSQTELFSLALAFVLIIITELQNTSFEAALDRIHPEQHEYIGKSKDMAAGAVLVAGIFALAIVVFIFVNHTML